MKLLWTLILLATAVAGFAQAPSHREMAGTWQMYDLRIELHSPDEVQTVANNELMSKLQLSANIGEYHLDSTYTDAYYGEGNKELGKASGTWYMDGDTFRVFPESGAGPYAYHITMSGDTGTFSGYVDWDNDGEQDDLMHSRSIRIAGDMKTYYYVSLYSATPDEEYTPEERQDIQAAHLANIRRLGEEGKLILAGPFLDREELRGIFILSVDSMEEAESFVNTDPAVQAGVLRMEVRPWWGPAELMGIWDE